MSDQPEKKRKRTDKESEKTAPNERREPETTLLTLTLGDGRTTKLTNWAVYVDDKCVKRYDTPRRVISNVSAVNGELRIDDEVVVPRRTQTGSRSSAPRAGLRINSNVIRGSASNVVQLTGMDTSAGGTTVRNVCMGANYGRIGDTISVSSRIRPYVPHDVREMVSALADTLDQSSRHGRRRSRSEKKTKNKTL